MNTNVNFELAKLLKEKGFDKPTFYYYENEKLTEPYLENGSSTDVDFRVDLSDLKEHFNKWSKRVSAPTIAEVVMWLYEKYGIWISVQPTSVVGVFQFRTYHNNNGVMSQHWNDSMSKNFNSPTEAYEAAIDYVLQKLI